MGSVDGMPDGAAIDYLLVSVDTKVGMSVIVRGGALSS